MRAWVIALIVLAGCAGIAWAQDPAAGEQVFRRMCLACHDVGPAAKAKLGPPLNGINGRKAGTYEGYTYTDANKNSGIVWSETTFAPYIRSPTQAIPGTKMAFAGLKNDKDIVDLWAYLKQFGPDGQKQ
jgi:cytochrome c